MKKTMILIILIFACFCLFLEGCRSQYEDEAASREKMKDLSKDFTPEKYMEGKGKPKKPYWEE